MLSCGCRCALAPTEEQLLIHAFQYYSIIYLNRNKYIPGTSIHIMLVHKYTIYVEANTWNTFILGSVVQVRIPLYLRVFVLMSPPPEKNEYGLFAPVFASIIVIVIVIVFWVFSAR